jgi:23S rRNA (guanosine2251-2'-O)-methyltransferase
LLDGLSDPHNVGACLRSAAAADVDAVIVPKNRSCHLTPTVRKISCGASELIPFVVVTNMVRTINFLKDKGVMIYGSDLQATKTYDEVEYAHKNALIIGSEDKGIRRLTRENCDELVKIGMSKNMDSLNASVSAGILLFEISRQNKINLNK